jgi:AraC-like DNA-binding protein
VFVLSGTARHLLNGVEPPIGPTSVFLLSPTDFHEIHASTAEPLRCYNVVIDPLVAERHLDELVPSGSGWLPSLVHDFAAAEPDFRRLWSESLAGRAGAAPLMEAVLRCILIELARRSDSNTSGSAPDRSPSAHAEIWRAVLFVDRHFREPLALADVAAQAHLSPNYFSERFRQLTGTSFQAYLQQRRLRFARSLLASTSLDVTAICHAAGFNNVSHFGRAYRRRYGECPSAVRTSQRQARLNPFATAL